MPTAIKASVCCGIAHVIIDRDIRRLPSRLVKDTQPCMRWNNQMLSVPCIPKPMNMWNIDRAVRVIGGTRWMVVCCYRFARSGLRDIPSTKGEHNEPANAERQEPVRSPLRDLATPSAARRA